MVLIYLKSGECIEFTEGAYVELEDSHLLCRDESGALVGSFMESEVVAYTADEDVAEIMQDEVCEDLQVDPPAVPGNGTLRT